MFRRTLMTLRFRGGRLTFAYQRCSVVDNQTHAQGTQARRRQPSEVESERVGPSRYTKVKIAGECRAIFQQSQTIPLHCHSLWQSQPDIPGVCVSRVHLDHASMIHQHDLAHHFIHFICLCYSAILLSLTSGMENLIRVLVCFPFYFQGVLTALILPNRYNSRSWLLQRVRDDVQDKESETNPANLLQAKENPTQTLPGAEAHALP